MATPQQMEKKRSRQIEEILAAVKGLAADVAELKDASPQVIELSAEIDERPDRIGELMAANGQAFAEAAELSRRILEAVGMMAGELIALKGEITELKDSLQAVLILNPPILEGITELRTEIAFIKRMQETQNQAQEAIPARRKTKK